MRYLRQGRDLWYSGLSLSSSFQSNLEAECTSCKGSGRRYSPPYQRMYSVPPFRQGNPRYLIFGVTLNMLKALCTSGCFFSARYSVVCKVIFHAQGITSRVHGDHSRALRLSVHRFRVRRHASRHRLHHPVGVSVQSDHLRRLGTVPARLAARGEGVARDGRGDDAAAQLPSHFLRSVLSRDISQHGRAQVVHDLLADR